MPALNRAFHWSAFALACFILTASVACDLLPLGILSPATSAPKFSEYDEFWGECERRENVIDEWEDKRLGGVAEKWIDGEITLFRAGLDGERIEEEAEEKRRELQRNCFDAWNEGMANIDTN